LIDAAYFDKIRRERRITLILPERVGKYEAKSISMDEAADLIRLGMNK
jgi:hypothetical protein